MISALDRLRRSAWRRRNREVAVLFTRTIRRTMVCGLAMVLCMMIGLLLSAIYSHLSYRSIIGRLHFAFRECPQKPALAGSLVNLQSPLLDDVRETSATRGQGTPFPAGRSSATPSRTPRMRQTASFTVSRT